MADDSRVETGGEPAARVRKTPVPLPDDSMLDRLESVALWGAGVSWLVPSLGTMTLLQHLLSADRIERLNRLYCSVQIALTGSRWEAVVHPKVDPERPYLFMQNHTNHFDHVAMYNASPHFKQGIELEAHFKYPFYGWFMRSRGTIGVPTARKGRTARIREQMQAEVERNHSILGFPEGTRTTTGRLGKLRTGLFFIARDIGLPIVPTTVTGMYDLMRKGSALIRPGHRLTVYMDEPIEMAGRNELEVLEAVEQTRAAMSGRIEAYWRERGYE
ncbi:MAG: 1-acyl-sn-glycerol-3-phosphate acyltransferase [Myxococcales bacterium]|nr:1-acyl-sn-glycerol-3-phosphate acyltransferase [Myxococcales bacterium]